MTSNMVHSYDKHTKVAMVACTPQEVTCRLCRGSNSFDKDSHRVALASVRYVGGGGELYPVAVSLILYTSWYKYVN